LKNLYRVIISLVILFFSACSDSAPSKHYDAKKLLKQKCASCHNIDMPPSIFEDEIAPPMMSVAFHVVTFVQTSDESQKILKAKEFVKDYVINPSADKSFCDKKSLQIYGVMPSQKGKVTEGELDAITNYMFEHFTQKNLSKIEKEKREFDALPAGKKLALKYKCFNCHRVNTRIVGPSFKDIAKIYSHDAKENIIKSIKYGSNTEGNGSKRAIMPAFKTINEEDLNILSQWIIDI
jgi:cytochrome c